MKLLKWLFEPGCSHRFTWPRVGSNGRHYQICLRCAAAYEYDWEKMHLTRREHTAPVQHAFAETAPLARTWQKVFQRGTVSLPTLTAR